MTNRFEDLWDSADDGASTPLGPLEIRDRSGTEALLEAWYVERRNSIECELVLGESRRLIARLLAEDELCPRRRKKAARLLRAIDATLRLVNSVEA